MRGRTLRHFVLAAMVLLVAACSGYTTAPTNIAKQPDGSYTAQLNFVGSCGAGGQCSWYAQYRLVGTNTWTHVPATAHGPVAGPASNVSLSETATGLTPGAQYEYQVCGNTQPGQPFTCVGPDHTPNTTTKFAAAAWSLQTSPNHLDPNGDLSATSCSSATACIAVGNYTNGNGDPMTLAERWDGSAWTIQTTPTVSGSLNGVSCTSATACIAVGSSNGATLAERWNGSTWTTQTTPSGGSSLNAVSCTSATACTAVGSNSRGVAMAERWDGSTWTIQSTPDPSAPEPSSLSGVSCTSATACIAVGASAIVDGDCGLLAERWDGSTWTIQTIPTPSGFEDGCLNGVSCTSATACTAVGYYLDATGVSFDYVTLAERWDGSTWTIQATPNPNPSNPGGASLWGVSCTTATACTAVGSPPYGSNKVTLAESWDGSTWTIQTTPSSGSLYGVSCTSAAACTAVGSTGATLAERWGGMNWVVQTTPTPIATLDSRLAGVSCASITSCTAVGSYIDSSGTHELSEFWDGTSWTIPTTPNPNSTVLNGVSCTSAMACTAVGSSSGCGSFCAAATAAEFWDGASWTIQPTPNPSFDSVLNGASCTSATACTAVGSSNGGTLAERWDGNTWTIQTTPTLTGGVTLSGVSCTSATACTAVGPAGLAERWDGNTWTIQTTPSTGSLNAVSCTSATACTAVGPAGLAERWDGNTWAIQTTPSTGSLNGVSCTSATACTAVGYHDSPNGLATTLAERYSG